MATEYQPTNLQDLPDELLLEIALHLAPIRSFEPQSEAFKLKEKEIARQCENSQRQKALYSLCLVSQRLKAVFEPTLYSAFISSTAWSGFKPLECFLRTLDDQPALASRVQYIENRLSDYQGHSLYDDMELFRADDVKDYFDILAIVILSTANLVHLSVVSLETSDVSLWRHLVQDKRQTPRMAAHGFPKLQTLCLQIHSEGFDLEATSWFQRIANALLLVPTLKDFRVSGATSGSVNLVAGTYKSLNTIDLSECILDLDELVQLTSACTALQRLSCHWAYLDSQGLHFNDLHTALFAHKETLEHLHLDAREVRLFPDDCPVQPLGSLRDFHALKSLELCEASLLGHNRLLLDLPDGRLLVGISHLLPISLESFTLLVKTVPGQNADWWIDDLTAGWDVFEDCLKMLPNLKKLQIKSNFWVIEVKFSTIGEKPVRLQCFFMATRGVGTS